jgi:hypothetical protein
VTYKQGTLGERVGHLNEILQHLTDCQRFYSPHPSSSQDKLLFSEVSRRAKKKKKEKKRCVLDQDLTAKTLQGAVISFFFFSFLVKNPT